GIHGVGLAQRRLEVPRALELPRMRCAVVPLMRARRAVVDELVVDGFPRRPTVARALDELTEPRRALRAVDAVRIGWRSLEVIDLPAAEVRSADVPPVALPVGCQHERAFARPYE